MKGFRARTFESMLWAIAFLFFFAAPVFAQGFAKEGVTVSLLYAKIEPGGEFEEYGFGYFEEGNEYLSIPAVSGGTGFGIAVGGREKKWAIDLSYLNTKLDAEGINLAQSNPVADTATITDLDARLHIISIDMRRHFFYNTRVQPFILFGWIPAAWIKIRDGAAIYDASGAVTKLDDATISAFLTGFDLGAGLSIFITPKVAINGSAIYRRMSFDGCRGASGISLDFTEHPIRAEGIGYLIQLSYTF